MRAAEAPLTASAREAHARIKRVGRTSAIVGAGLTFLAIGLFIPLVGAYRQEYRLALLNGPLIAVYLIVSVLLLERRGTRRLDRSLAWLAENRAPDEREHRATLALPLYAVKDDALAWTVAGACFALLNGILESWELAAVVAATIWLGGETTCTLVYLRYERVLRPVTAAALVARRPQSSVAPGVRLRLAMAWLLGTGVPLVGMLALGVVGAFNWVPHSQYVGAAVLFLVLVAFATGYKATSLAAGAISDPLGGVRTGLEQIERGDLAATVTVDDGSEIGQLQAGFNRMVEGLRERQRIRDLFGRQVGEGVARAALNSGVRLGGEEREIAALFIDLVGSTALALELPATDVVEILNRFFAAVVETVQADGGLVNKFVGDAVLCVFGAPASCESPAGDALRCARALVERVARDLPEVDFGIGVSAGTAVAGNVGAEQRFEYTVIGDPVNAAARLAELAKGRPERVLASGEAVSRAPARERELWTITEAVVLRGRTEPTKLAHPAREPVGTVAGGALDDGTAGASRADGSR